MEPPTEPKGATISLKLPCILSQQLSQPPLKLPQPNMPKIEVFTLSPLFQADSTRTQPIQNANFLALELLEFSGDFLVQVCQTGESDGLSNGLSIRLSPNQETNSTRNDRTAMESLTEVWRTPMDTKQTAFLISIINKKYKFNK